MISKTKYKVNEEIIKMLFEKAGISGVKDIGPLGAGEYNSVYSVTTEERVYAIKIAPLNTSRVLTYEKNMMEQEVYYYGLMKDKTDISVPKIYYADFSKTLIPVNYFIMEKLSGQQLDEANLTPEEKDKVDALLAQMVADIHTVKGEKYGYRQNKLFNNWYLAIQNIIVNLIKDCKQLNKRTKNGEKLLEYVNNNKEVLEKVESTLINFDIWPANIFCSKEGKKIKLSWIDPERCFWGDRIGDFVCLNFMRFRLEEKSKIIKAYNEYSDNPITIGRDEKIRFAIMLGYLGTIMDVEKYARYSVFNKGYWRNVFVSRMLYSQCFSQLDELNKE